MTRNLLEWSVSPKGNIGVFFCSVVMSWCWTKFRRLVLKLESWSETRQAIKSISNAPDFCVKFPQALNMTSYRLCTSVWHQVVRANDLYYFAHRGAWWTAFSNSSKRHIYQGEIESLASNKSSTYWAPKHPLSPHSNNLRVFHPDRSPFLFFK